MSSCLAEFCIGESGSLWARRHGLGGRILSSSKLQLAVCSGDEVDISFRHKNLKQPHSNSTVIIFKLMATNSTFYIQLLVSNGSIKMKNSTAYLGSGASKLKKRTVATDW